MDYLCTIPYMARPGKPTLASILAGLPATFSYTDARAAGLSDRRLYALRDAGLIEPLGRGLFERADAVGDADSDLLEIAHRAPQATLCLTTALARHGLSDAIPARIDIALPRGQRHPRTQAPVTWHSFDLGTFDVGREISRLPPTWTLGCTTRSDASSTPSGCVTSRALRPPSKRCADGCADPAHNRRLSCRWPGHSLRLEPALRSTLEILL